MNYLEKVLARLSAKGGHSANGKGYKAHCPSKTHGGKGKDNNPSLTIDVREDGSLRLKCWSSRCHLPDILAGLNLNFSDLRPADGEGKAAATVQKYDESLRDADFYDRVYRDYLFKLPVGSSGKAHDNLVGRGFTMPEVITLGYGCVRDAKKADAVASHVAAHPDVGPKLLSVPGFVDGPGLKGNLLGCLVPLRDPSGRIFGVKTRYVDRKDGRRYSLWSSPEVPGWSGVHFPLRPAGKEFRPKTIRVTEGEIKADYLTLRTDVYTVSLPGWNSWEPLWDKLWQQAGQVFAGGFDTVLFALDWPDFKDDPVRAKSYYDFVHRTRNEKGLKVGLEVWPGPDEQTPNGLTGAKGLDDLVRKYEAAPLLEDRVVQRVLPDEQATNELRKSFLQDLAEGQEKESLVGDLEPFPFDVFPPKTRAFVLDVGRAVQATADIAAVGVLAAASRAIGSARTAALRADWREPSTLFLCVVGDPSQGKSPALSKALGPVYLMQTEDSNRYEYDRENNAQAHRNWAQTCKRVDKENDAALKKLVAGAAKGAPAPLLPPAQTLLYPEQPDDARVDPMVAFFTDDATVEVLATRLQENGKNHLRPCPSVLVSKDEFVGLVKSQGAYKGGRGEDKEFYLKAWAGQNVPIKVDRKKDNTTILISNYTLPIVGGIQPDVLPKLHDEAMSEDGWLPRLLFCVPKDFGDVVFEKALDEPLRAAWEATVRRVFTLKMGVKKEDMGVNKHGTPKKPRTSYFPIPQEFSPAAQAAFAQWAKDAQAYFKDRPEQKFLKYAWKKQWAYVARVALVLHYLWKAEALTEAEWGDGSPGGPKDEPILAETVARAAQVVQYFRHHYQEVQRLMRAKVRDKDMTQKERSDARRAEHQEEFHKYLADRQPGDYVRLRHVHFNRLYGCRDKETVEELFWNAQRADYGGRYRVKNKAGPVSVAFVVGAAPTEKDSAGNFPLYNGPCKPA